MVSTKHSNEPKPLSTIINPVYRIYIIPIPCQFDALGNDRYLTNPIKK